MENTIYEYSVKTIQGEDITLDKYQGKVLLIVNTASACGFTPQYEGLQSLYENNKEKGLEILGFPCNQFGQQEPENEATIHEFCQTKYKVTFPMFSKIDVNGTDAHPLYQFLTTSISGILNAKVKWNFSKFLIDRNGKPINRYAPITKPKNIEKDIIKLL